jgi:RecQ family ATP-dependent DNA helicase
MSTHFVLKCEEYAIKNFSLKGLRPAQKEVLQELFEKKYLIATLPTGAGKTLLYSLPALFFDDAPVLVISPLLSLMRDQERRMEDAHISCALLCSEQSEHEKKHAWQKIRSREAKIIFVSPERFVFPSFLNALSHTKLSMAVIDEAHCVVSWGAHFRPEYLEIGKILNTLRPPRILALTATAGRNCRQEIAKRVFPEKTLVSQYVSAPLGPNIFVESIHFSSQEQRWHTFTEILKNTSSPKTLVYFQTRLLCEESALKLKKLKFPAIVYHAGLEKSHKKQVEQQLSSSSQKMIVCATTAFGMGVDIAGIELVVVMGFPNDIEALFQMLGRAGRGGEQAWGLLLWTNADPLKRWYQLQKTLPPPSVFLKQCQAFASWMPAHVGESFFVKKDVLRNILPGKSQKDKEKNLENLLGGLRICGLIEDPSPKTPYYLIELAPSVSLTDLLQDLPPQVTKRKKVLQALALLTQPSWAQLKGAKITLRVVSLVTTACLLPSSCQEVFLYYQDQKKISFAKIEHESATQGVILKNGYNDLQTQLPRYISARSHFHASLRELENLAKSTTCRLSGSFQFFALHAHPETPKSPTPGRCLQCDLCMRKRME